MPVLVRIILHPAPCGRIQDDAHADQPAGIRSDAHARLSQMGDHHSLDDPGDAKCHPVGVDVHLPVEETQSRCQGQTGERVQAAHGGVDAGKQV